MTCDGSAARQAGLTTRPLTETATAALAWERELGLDRPRASGLTPDRERDLLRTLDAGGVRRSG